MKKIKIDKIKTVKKKKVIKEKPVKDLGIQVADETKKGLNQSIISSAGVSVDLSDALKEGDFWITSGRVKRTILTHDGVKKLADIAGVEKVVLYRILTQPTADNNYQYTIEATINSERHGSANELGEANRSNLGTKGRGNPANMAQKRAYDRAVFRLLGITGLLSEEELSKEESNNENKMDDLTHEEKQVIAPLMNQLILAKTQKHLIDFGELMKRKKDSLNDNQLGYLRKLYEKKVGELSDKKF